MKKKKITLGLLCLCNLVFAQNQQVARLDGSTISTAEIDKTINHLVEVANISIL